MDDVAAATVRRLATHDQRPTWLALLAAVAFMASLAALYLNTINLT